MSKISLKPYAEPLFALAVLSVALSGVGALGFDIYLASTQWLLAGVFLAVAAVYAKIS